MEKVTIQASLSDKVSIEVVVQASRAVQAVQSCSKQRIAELVMSDRSSNGLAALFCCFIVLVSLSIGHFIKSFYRDVNFGILNFITRLGIFMNALTQPKCIPHNIISCARAHIRAHTHTQTPTHI